MFGFLLRFLATGLLWASVLWFGIPKAKPWLEARFGSRRPEAAAEVQASLPPSRIPASRQPPDLDVPSRTTPVQTPVEPVPASPLPQPAQQPAPQQPPPEPPAPSPSPAPSAGPSYDWGVLGETVSSYSASGEPSGRLPGGTVVERVSVHDSSRGRIVRCRVLRDQQWKDGFFVPEPAIVQFQGPFVEAPGADRNQVIRYFTLKAKIDDRRAELQEQAIRANPHFPAYQAAAKAMTEFQAKTKQLIAQRDTATGLERGRLDDTLRRLKGEEATILHQFRLAEGPYKKWRATHDDGSVASAGDELLNRWESELSSLKPTVSGMVGGM